MGNAAARCREACEACGLGFALLHSWGEVGALHARLRRRPDEELAAVARAAYGSGARARRV